ncbi:DUF6059 family protein [Streptomyces sp. NPDC102359]|uniref:DUF6059 family protein n=1 Tax=unclassified Streptomyces TaxID=2593676 RepID=UPI00363538D6
MAFPRRRRVRRLVRAVAARVWQCLVAAGTIHTGGQARCGAVLLLDAPPPGHPERLRPDWPLTAVERALQSDLDPAR